MKKQFTLALFLFLTLLLTSCGTNQVEYIEVQVPVVVEKEVIKEVEVPVEVLVEVVKEVDVIKEIYIDSETKIVIDAVNTRQFLPGSYVNSIKTDDEVFYATVVIDQLGQIAGIQFDKQLTSNDVYVSSNNEYYVYVKGDGMQIPDSYKNILPNTLHKDFPTIEDAIDATDLVSGIDNTEIDQLVLVESYETSTMIGEEWLLSAKLLADKIVAEQTTYGVTTSVSGDLVTATNLTHAKNAQGQDIILTNVDILLALVQDVLNGHAYLRDASVLPEQVTYGLYTPGVYTTGSERTYNNLTKTVNQTVATLVVDNYGRIAGASEINMDGTSLETPQLVLNQTTSKEGVFQELLKEATAFTYAKGSYSAYDSTTNTMIYVRIGDDSKNLKEYSDGLIPVLTKNMNVSYENSIQSVILDSFYATKDAMYTVKGEDFPLYTYQQMYADTEGEDATRTVEIYLDGSTYYAVAPLGYDYYPAVGDVDRIDHLDKVELSSLELETVSPVKGIETVELMGEDNSNRLTTIFENSYSPYVLGVKTLGLSASDALIQSLMVEALHKAKLAYEYEAKGDYQFANQLKYSPYSSVSFNTTKLADGIYVADTFGTFDGSKFIGYMDVKDHVIQQIIFDKLLYNKLNIQSENALGDNSVVDTPDTNKDFEDMATMDADLLLNDIDQVFMGHLFTGFTYELEETFGLASIATAKNDLLVDASFISTASGPYYKDLLFTLLLDAGIARVTEIAEEYGKLLTNLPMVAGALYEGRNLDLPMYAADDNLLLYSDEINFRVSFDYTNTDFLDDQLVSSNPVLFVDETVTSSHKETVTMTLTYDTYQVSFAADFLVVPLASITKEFLDFMETSFTTVTSTDPTTDVVTKLGLYGIKKLTVLDSDTSLSLKKNLDTAHSYYPSDLPVLWYELIGSTLSTVPLNFTDGNADGKVVYSELTDYPVSSLDPGTHTLKLRTYYKQGTDGFLGTTDDSFVEKTVTITVLSNSDAVLIATPEVIPGTLVQHGNITKSSYILPTKTSVTGVSINWSLPGGVNVTSGTVQPTGVLETEDITSYINANSTLLATLSNGVQSEILGITRGSEDQNLRLNANLINTAGTVLSTIEFEFIVKAETNKELSERLNQELRQYYQNVPEFIFLDQDVTNSGNAEKQLIASNHYPTLYPYNTDHTILYEFDYSLEVLDDSYYVAWGDSDGVLDTTITDDYYVLLQKIGSKDKLIQSYTVSGLSLPTRTITQTVGEDTAGSLDSLKTNEEDLIVAYLHRTTGILYLPQNSEFDGYEAGQTHKASLLLHTMIRVDKNGDDVYEFETSLSHPVTLLNETNSISLISGITNNAGALTIDIHDDYLRILSIEGISLPTIFATSGSATFVPKFDTGSYKLISSSVANDGVTTYAGKTSSLLLELFDNDTSFRVTP